MFKGVSNRGGGMDAGFDLYEFPQDHEGRKTYVSVRGHSRSIPAPYTYKGTDGRNHVRPEFGGDWSGLDGYSHAVAAPMLVRDMSEYRSPIDNSMITSRSQHREHMRTHDVIELGNERVAPPPANTSAERYERGKAIKQHLDQVRAMPEPEYRERISKQATEARERANG